MLECCPTSNVVLGLYPSYAAHPFPALRAAGVRVTLGSDDPPYWAASIGGEYAVAAERVGPRDAELREITRTALARRLRPTDSVNGSLTRMVALKPPDLH